MPNDPKERTFHIRPTLAGQTVAAALKQLLRDVSWAEAKRLTTGRHVHVNGNLVTDDARRLKNGDVVKVFEHPRAAVPTGRDVRMRYVDADLIVVEKPAGMTTLRHAEERGWDDRRKRRQPTLDEVVQQMLPELTIGRAAPRAGGEENLIRRGHPLGRGNPPPPAKKGKGRHPPHATGRRNAPTTPPPPPASNLRVRPVHRLDRDTSGLMLFALSARAEPALVAMFKAHSIRRAYLAVAHGRVEAQTFSSYITRDRGDGLRGSTPHGASDAEAKHAVTHVKPVQQVGDAYTVIECRLETGRTHQIRIHLAEAGHMLCGEKVYTRPKPGAEAVTDDSGAPRHALHSAELEFIHPGNDQVLKFEAPLPRDLNEWLNRLKRQ